jgi:hypothetical protein
MSLVPSEKRYPAVRILIGLLRLVAAVPTFLGIFAILAGGAEVLRGKTGTALLIATAISIGPLLVGLVLFAASECLRILMDIEHNTRATADEVALMPVSIASRIEDQAQSFQSR